MKKARMEQALAGALRDNVRVTEELHDALELVHRLNAEVATMKEHWRPVPIAHPWQPKNPARVLCDEPRDAARHNPALGASLAALDRLPEGADVGSLPHHADREDAEDGA